MSYYFLAERTRDGRALRILAIIDEYTWECLSITTTRHLTSQDVLRALFHLFICRGVPAYTRSDNGPEFTAKAVWQWLGNLGVATLFIEPGSLWANGYIESFNGKIQDKLLNRAMFTTLTEAQILIENWRRE